MEANQIASGKPKLCLVGIPCSSGYLSAYVVDGLLKMNKPIPTSYIIIERQSVDAARNHMLKMAIEMNVDYVLFLDDDGVVPEDTLKNFLEDDKDIVCAPIPTRNVKDNGKHNNCCFEKYDFHIGDGRTVKKYRSIESFDMSKGYLHKIDACGGACLLIKKEVFTTLFQRYNAKPFEFIHEEYTTKEHGLTIRNISEDMTFTERAVQEGFELWVDLRVRPVHLGKPELIRFEMEGEKLPKLNDNKLLPGMTALSETLKVKVDYKE
jgi:glycosyltransferase involved in cell wall biosynthesis